jgi:hypothetical protein
MFEHCLANGLNTCQLSKEAKGKEVSTMKDTLHNNNYNIEKQRNIPLHKKQNTEVDSQHTKEKKRSSFTYSGR